MAAAAAATAVAAVGRLQIVGHVAGLASAARSQGIFAVFPRFAIFAIEAETTGGAIGHGTGALARLAISSRPTFAPRIALAAKGAGF